MGQMRTMSHSKIRRHNGYSFQVGGEGRSCNAGMHPPGCACGFGVRGVEGQSEAVWCRAQEAKREQVAGEWFQYNCWLIAMGYMTGKVIMKHGNPEITGDRIMLDDRTATERLTEYYEEAR